MAGSNSQAIQNLTLKLRRMRKFDYYFVHHCHNIVVFLEWRQRFKQSFIVLSVTFLTEVNYM